MTFNFSTELPGFLKTLYRNILDRDLEDQAPIGHLTNHVRFHGISSTISMLFTSDDFKVMNLPPEAIVDKLYASILGREGEWDGKKYLLRRIRHGDAMQTIVDDFVGSTEYRLKAQMSTVPPHDIPIFTWNPAGGMPDFIKSLYQNILSRDPLPDDHPNIDHWMDHTRLHGIASTISGFFATDEFKAKNFPQEVIVDKLYRSILGREAGWDGKNYWIDRLRHGDTVQAIVSDCIESVEYREKAQAGIVPPSNIPILTWHSAGGISHFIKTLYHNVLSRQVRSDESIDGWINHARFHGIAATITEFFTSDEFQTKNLPQQVVVDKLYRSILGREGGGDEKNILLAQLRGGLAIHIVVIDLVGSDEYKQKAQLGAVPSPDIPIFTWNPAGRMPDFIKTLYQNILSRDPDNEGSSHWTNHTRFFAIASTISGIFTSDEFQAKHFPHEVIVDKLYCSILGRECRGDERTEQAVRLRDGVSICTIINDLVGSGEYRQKAQLGAVPLPDAPIFEWNPINGADDFGKTLYQNILSRDPEEAVRVGWESHFRSHGMASTFTGFFTSEEFICKRLPHEDIVDKLYRSILGRECRGDEKTDQIDRLRNGVAICVIINGLVGSDEYRQRVQLEGAPSLNT